MVEITRRGLLGTGAVGVLAPSAAAGDVLSAQTFSGGAPNPRQRLLMDFDWRFALGHAADSARDFGFGRGQYTFAKQGVGVAAAAAVDFDDTAWRQIRLPHDWAVELPFAQTRDLPANAEDDPRAPHGFKPLGRAYPDTSIGWYRKSFDIPETDLGKRISIEFDGVFRDCLVMINGYAVFNNESGYAPFRVDITDFANYGGKNVVTVRVDATLGEGWFYEGAGIYRHVWLVKTDPLHVPQWGAFVRATPSGDGARLDVSVDVVNEADAAQSCDVRVVVKDADGRTVASGAQPISVEAGATGMSQQSLQLNGAHRWSIETPYLYQLQAEIRRGGALIDADTTTFGVRSIRFDPERGYFLNEQPVKLRGTCNHQDHAGVGSALPDALQTFRIRKLKEMGSNAYRTSHNPPTPELLDACDRLGMVVIDETRPMSSAREGMSQLERMVRRDRNHPCVILWSIGNEEQAQQGTARGARIARSMRKLIDRLDGSRPLVAAQDGGFGEGISQVIDVLGFNYRTDQMAAYHTRVPRQPIMGTETGSTVSTRGEYARNDARHIVPAYDREHPWWATTAEFWWKIIAEQPFNAGGFIWTGFDYRGEPTPFNKWPSISSYFGVLDTCGFPKDNFYYYQAWWTQAPVLHLFPHWNWHGKEGQEIEVWCHSNLDRVELLLNGEVIGAQDVPRNGHCEFHVLYTPGVLRARGYRGGRIVLTQDRVTTGAPAGLRLRADRAHLSADGEDCAVVSVEVIDAAGRVVPTAAHNVTFALTGPGDIIGVGNGDPTCLESDQNTQRSTFNGLCMAIVRARKASGRVRVTATSPGLRNGVLDVVSDRAQSRPSI